MKPTKKQIEAAAAAIGALLGPGDGHSRWSESYTPTWPDDYASLEQERMREAAKDALAAVKQ